MTTKKKRKWESGISAIKPSSFYSSEAEKTKLNWFRYELSMSIYDSIMENFGERLIECGISEETLAEFAIRASKEVNGSNPHGIPGKTENPTLSCDMAKAHFPELSDDMIDGVLNAVSKAWDEMLDICRICPTRCMSEKDERCTMFDDDTYSNSAKGRT